MPNFQFHKWIAVCLVAFFAGSAYGQSTTTWQGTTSGSWNDSLRWLPGLPTINLDAWISTTTAQTITNSGGTTDAARSLNFSGANHTLSGGNLWLQSGSISVDTTRTATITSSLAGASGLIKSGNGTLALDNNVNLIAGGITINSGTIRVSNASTRLSLGNNAITLNGGTLAFSNSNAQSYLREFGGTGLVDPGATSGWTLNISSLRDTTYGNSLGSAAAGAIVKAGPGTLTITGSFFQHNNPGGFLRSGGLTFGGTAGGVTGASNAQFTLQGGTLTLDNSVANNTNRWVDTLPLSITTNTRTNFRYIGRASAASTETFGAFGTTSNSALTIDVRPGNSGTAALTFGSYTAQTHDTARSFVNFTAGTSDTFGVNAQVLFTTAPTLVNSVLPTGIVKGKDFATYVSGSGVLPFASYSSNVNTTDATQTLEVNASDTLTAARRYNALKIVGSSTISTGTFQLGIGSTTTTNYLAPMILKTGAGQAEIAASISGANVGSIAGVTANTFTTYSNFSFYVDEGVLKLSAPLSNNPRMVVRKAGDGVLWLDPIATWKGIESANTKVGIGMYVNEGAVRLNPLQQISGTNVFNVLPMVLSGGVMELTGGITYNPTIGTGDSNLRWTAGGGFAAFGANATFQPNIAWNATNQIGNGFAMLLNSKTADSRITLSGTLNLGTATNEMWLREIFVEENTGSTGDFADISGPIIADTTAGGGGTPTINFHFVKSGPGTLRLTNANNTYSGASYVQAGTLLVNGALATPASSEVARNPEYTAVNVMSSGMLGGTGTISRVVRVESGGVLAPGDSTQALTTGIFTIGADASIVSGGTLALQINGATAGTLYDQLQLTSGNLNIDSSSLSIDWGSFPTTSLTHLWIVNNTGAGTTTGMFAGLGNDATVNTVNGTEWKIRYNVDSSAATASTTPATGTGNDIVLYAIPEPSTLALVGCGLLGLVVCARRRLK